MKFFCLLFSCLMIALSFALSHAIASEPPPTSSGLLSISKTPENEITLIGPSCQELIAEDQQLRNWKLAMNEVPGPQLSPVQSADKNSCSLLINNSIPKMAQELQGQRPHFNGPNCWNSALKFSGINSYLRFTSAEEISFWLHSNYCQEIREDETSIAGDIIEIRTTNLENPHLIDEVHAMIYISDDLVFSKNTSGRSSPYGIQRASLIYQIFRADNRDCKKIQGQNAECLKWANHFRCKSPLNDRLQFEKNNLTYGSFFTIINTIEKMLSAFVLRSEGNIDEIKASTLNKLIELEIAITNISKGDNSFFYQALLQEINSLKIQIRILSK